MRTVILIAIAILVSSPNSSAQTDYDGDGDIDMRDFAQAQLGAGDSSVDQSAEVEVLAGSVQIGISCSDELVLPGDELIYEITGVLFPTSYSEGLALWSTDLVASFDTPGGLPLALPGPRMCSFVRPLGFTNPPGPENDECFNPSGYGGTPIGLETLVQIGGGQNTIGNTPPPSYPIGEVIPGIGFEPTLFAIGFVRAPQQSGTYSLTLSGGFANVLDSPFVGPPFAVSAAVVVYSHAQCQFTVLPDCNENGSPDSQDIAAGVSDDCNENGVPDECEPVTVAMDMMESCTDGPCEHSPCTSPASGDACCEAADQDGDGDVDLRDYSLMIEAAPSSF